MQWSLRGTRTWWGGVVARGAVVFAGAASTAGCLDRPFCSDDCRPRTTNIFVETVDQRGVDKIDLLFMIDNSQSMADKQVVLSQAVPDLVRRLVSPNCVGDKGVLGDPHPGGQCDDGFSREFEPINDIHIGVITSSLGGHGGSICLGSDDHPEQTEQGDDHAHLIGSRPRFMAASFGGKAHEPITPPGFLDWNPEKKVGERIDDVTTTFQAMTTAAGEDGCGFEAQLESVYRFLADPSPPASVTSGPCPAGVGGTCAIVSGRDDELIRERAAFLRPDSLVAVVMLTDENDCSIRDGGQYVYATAESLGGGSAACATNPNDRCCYPCSSTRPPDGCPKEAACGALPEDLDNVNLRCVKQKQRFGVDFLYPVARYVNALSDPTLCTSRADLDAKNPSACPDANKDAVPDVVTNPLFAGGRQADLVFVAGILGVPWQDLRATTDKDGNPFPDGELHYKTAKTLAEDGTWDLILGNDEPGNFAPPIFPRDALMVEQTSPRQGNDGAGRLLAGSGAGPMANPVNGHEREIDKDDLEYACIFPLPVDPATGVARKPCADPRTCDCPPETGGTPLHNPLCQDPATGSYGTDQYFAKAYPGLRELAVLKGFGDDAIVASICARNLEQSGATTAQDYGYRPAIDAIIERLQERLTGRCLPRALRRDVQTNQYPCSVVEAQPAPGLGCDPSRGRVPLRGNVGVPARDQLRATHFCDGPGQIKCADLSLCELKEAGPECHKKDAKQPTPGYCYVDPAQNPDDDPKLVDHCTATAQRMLRFVDPLDQTPAPGARVVIACFGADLGVDP